MVLGRVELPQVKSPSLTREDLAEEHDLDYVDKFNLLVHQVLDAGLESGHRVLDAGLESGHLF